MESKYLCYLRHDFRRFYSCSYDEVRDEEAIDLIRTLPDGSLTVSAINPARSWEKWQHSLANLQDQILALFARRQQGEEPPRVTRPQDLVERKKALEAARKARERIKNQEWEEV